MVPGELTLPSRNRVNVRYGQCREHHRQGNSRRRLRVSINHRQEHASRYTGCGRKIKAPTSTANLNGGSDTNMNKVNITISIKQNGDSYHRSVQAGRFQVTLSSCATYCSPGSTGLLVIPHDVVVYQDTYNEYHHRHDPHEIPQKPRAWLNAPPVSLLR